MIPLDCVSLAANALQFVDFTIRLVAKSNDIARSADGRLAEHADLHVVSSDLTTLKTKLRESKQILSIHASLTEEDQALVRLSDGCLEVAKELQKALDELQQKGKPNKWRSVRQALKTIRKKEQIDSLYRRLSSYRSQLDSRTLAGIASRVELIKVQQSERFGQVSKEIREANDSLRSSAARAQEQLIETITKTSGNTQQSIEGVQEHLDSLTLSEQRAHTENISLHAQTKLAVSSSEYKLSRQLELAEAQIAQLRQDIRNIQVTITEVMKQGQQNPKKGQSERQKKFDEYLKGLYALWAAKEMLLQELVIFVNAAKKLLCREWTAIKQRALSVVPFDRLDMPTGPMPDSLESNISVTDDVHPYTLLLFDAIRDDNLDWLVTNKDWYPYVNSMMERQCFIAPRKSHLPGYKRQDKNLKRVSRRVYSYRTTMTALVFAVLVFAWRFTSNDLPKLGPYVFRKVLNLLHHAGANFSLPDSNGIGAWFHADALSDSYRRVVEQAAEGVLL